MDLAAVTRLLPSLARLSTQMVLLSGGEPLLNPEWEAIAQVLRVNGLKVWLLTSGLALAKHARRAATLFDAITVSLDGTDAETYAAIRGLDAFHKVCEGIRAAAAHGAPPGIRVTLQRANFRQLPAFVDLAKDLGAQRVSFLPTPSAAPMILSLI
jgi:MoaA/NifB/PqqE/SkfB family radical SAM enzyme